MDNEYINILLLDDDEDEYIITNDYIDKINGKYNLHWVDNMNKALIEITSDKYDICLSDYNLGEFNGIDFIKEAIRAECKVPIILLTGQGDHNVDILAMKAGAVDYIDKNTLDPNIIERSIRYSLERKKSEERITFLAYYDQLTLLPNRTLFYNRLNMAYSMAKRHKRQFAILFLDIDNFKRINDSLGHDSGDILIKRVGERLLNCIRNEDILTSGNLTQSFDTVARLGGDEFTIILTEINEAENATKVAERICNVLKKPIMIDNRWISITMSIGISIYPLDGDNIETLIKSADLAMYDAKNSGRNNYKYFNSVMHSNAIKKLDLENELRDAIANNELIVYYQPIVDLKLKRINKCEALVRWNHPKDGIVPPIEFIPIAEETGIIFNIGNFVLEQVANLDNKLSVAGEDDFNVSVNISPRQLKRSGFIDDLIEFIKKNHVNTNRITFEITESCVVDDMDEANKMVERLKSLGIQISLDDFGTGYSSFKILDKLNFDVLKIDKSFIDKVPDNKPNSTIVSSLISIGHSMGLKVVAEGIETLDQLRFLEANECDLGQGYYFYKPLSEKEIIEIVKKYQ